MTPKRHGVHVLLVLDADERQIARQGNHIITNKRVIDLDVFLRRSGGLSEETIARLEAEARALIQAHQRNQPSHGDAT